MTTFTVFATGTTDLTLDDIASGVRAELDRLGVTLVRCNWAPDPDTIADATDFERVELVDLN